MCILACMCITATNTGMQLSYALLERAYGDCDVNTWMQLYLMICNMVLFLLYVPQFTNAVI